MMAQEDGLPDGKDRMMSPFRLDYSFLNKIWKEMCGKIHFSHNGINGPR
jgi:hypothetical protein